ncbi:MAG: hypothetical protein RBR35_07860 [Salinivirgaceae bacterium]|nr:hypothetical protein [Salinivirgaceae bacterium]
MNRHEESEGARYERTLEAGGQVFRPETAPGVNARIRAARSINTEPAKDQLFRIAAKLAFVRESAPMIYLNCEFSRLGLDEMSFVLDSIMDDIQEAVEYLDAMPLKQAGMEG